MDAEDIKNKISRLSDDLTKLRQDLENHHFHDECFAKESTASAFDRWIGERIEDAQELAEEADRIESDVDDLGDEIEELKNTSEENEITAEETQILKASEGFAGQKMEILADLAANCSVEELEALEYLMRLKKGNDYRGRMSIPHDDNVDILQLFPKPANWFSGIIGKRPFTMESAMFEGSSLENLKPYQYEAKIFSYRKKSE